MNYDQVKYYSERAKEYEKIYLKPERQNDLSTISQYLKDHFMNKTVMEIACGTGYWTKFISESAESVVASDINENVLKLAKSKMYKCPVDFIAEDVFNISRGSGSYDAGFGGFIWSHISVNELAPFLKSFLANIKPGGTAIFIDNEYVEGNSTPIAFYDDEGNTYQIRKLDDGSEYRVIKNYPSDDKMIDLIRPFASEYGIKRLRYFWILRIILS